MGVLIVMIADVVLVYFGVISSDLGIGILLSAISWLFAGMALYFEFGLFKFWYHDLLGWHTPDDSPQWSDGCSQHAICKHCGKEIMQDSQGNWF